MLSFNPAAIFAVISSSVILIHVGLATIYSNRDLLGWLQLCSFSFVFTSHLVLFTWVNPLFFQAPESALTANIGFILSLIQMILYALSLFGFVLTLLPNKRSSE